MNGLLDQIADFNKTMDQIVQLVEEAKALARQLENVSFAEGPVKIKEIFEICDEGIKNLKKAEGQAEDMQRTLGGGR